MIDVNIFTIFTIYSKTKTPYIWIDEPAHYQVYLLSSQKMP